MNISNKKINTKKGKLKDTGRKSCFRSCTKAVRTTLQPGYKVYKEFCNETTLHGLKHTVAEEFHWLERFLWLVVTLFAFAGATGCALTQLVRYNSEPVVVSMQRDYRTWWFTFPAVTACFSDRVDVYKAKMVIESNWNVTEESDLEKYQYYYEFIELVSDVSFRTNLQNFWRYQSDETVKGIDLLQLALSVHPTQPLNVIVSQSNKEVQWIPVMTEVGMCMTFNSVYAQYQFTLSDVEWQAEELLKCHYHSEQCFVRMDSLNNAVRYFVHSPFEISTAISNPTGEIDPGEELIIDFKISSFVFGSFVDKMATCVMRTGWRVSGGMLRYSLIYPRTSQNAPACPNAQSSTIIHTQKRALFASLGGTTALFVGASVLTVVETALYIIRQIVNLIVKMTTSSRVVEFKP